MNRVTKTFISVIAAIIVSVIINIKPSKSHESYCPKESVFGCKVSLPQKEKKNGPCECQRYAAIVNERKYWKLTNPISPDDSNPDVETLYPKLDQPDIAIAKKARFDPLDNSWFWLHGTMTEIVNKTGTALVKAGFLQHPLTNFQDYRLIHDKMKASLSGTSANFYANPVDLPGFTDIISTDSWQKDKYFTQRRLAGICPFFIRKVLKNKDAEGMMNFEILKKSLNQNFNWDEQISQISNEQLTLEQVVNQGRLFVLYHEEYSTIEEAPDLLDFNPFDEHKMFPKVSPITLFVVNKENDLEVVAIQKDNMPDSAVATPSIGNDPELEKEWLLAKGIVDGIDMAVCQSKWHLLDSHVTEAMFCIVFRRHFSSRHPLYELIESHCEGTVPVTAIGVPSLIKEFSFAHKLFPIGDKGARKLINTYYQKQHYDDSDFELLLKGRGLDDLSQFRYYPFRDDGRLIWDETRKFSWQFVDLYYRSDKDIQEDWELQGFVDEISADGSVSNGAKYKGFPRKFTTKKDLATFLTRFIWINVHHVSTSFPLVPYASYIPITATKLYYDPREEAKTNYAYNLPNATGTLVQATLTFSLATLRINRLFGYSKRMSDEEGRKVVENTYQRLNTLVQKTLQARNQQRFDNGDLTYQYFEPKWLPNSIHV